MARKWISAALGLIGLVMPGAAAAICDVTYKVQPGETLPSVAARHFGEEQKWTLIYGADQQIPGGQDLAAGTDIYIPRALRHRATEGALTPEAPREVAAPASEAEPPFLIASRGELVVLTGRNYAPFSDRPWPKQGLAAELVREDEWSLHLVPLLDEMRRDMGFPSIEPDCAATPEKPACVRFHYCDPLMDLPVMLFKRADGDLTHEDDADLSGRRLYRSAGVFIHDLDRAGRRWLSEGVIDVVQPATPEACFEALVAGEVDAVTVKVFLGAAKIVSVGLRGRVVPLDTRLSRETLHGVIAKTNPRGTTHLYRINSGLEALRESGRYDDVVSRHPEFFWNRLE